MFFSLFVPETGATVMSYPDDYVSQSEKERIEKMVRSDHSVGWQHAVSTGTMATSHGLSGPQAEMYKKISEAKKRQG